MVAGKHNEKLEILLPCDIKSGEYELQIGIGGKDLPSVVFATNATQDGEYSVLAKVELYDL